MTRTGISNLPMELTARWRKLRRAHDSRSPSERRLLVLAVVAVLWLVMDTAWVTPSYARFNDIRTRLRSAQADQQARQEAQQRQAADLATLQTALDGELKQLRAQVSQEDQLLAQAQSRLIPAREMRSVLEGLLNSQARVRLLGMKTVRSKDFRENTANGEAAVLYRHGLEIRVQGAFHDLVGWLRSVEALPRQLLWSGMRLEADPEWGLTLTVRLFTLSRDQDPLEIAQP